MRKKILFGNWKMNKTNEEALAFAKVTPSIVKLAKEHDVILGIAPSYLALETLKKGTEGIVIAAQNVHYLDHGAYTGEVSIPMLKAIGIDTALIGHSERRTYDNETNEKCHLKIVSLLKNDMVPLYCVGETLEQFNAKKTKEIVETQVVEGLKDLDEEAMKKVIVAYEPVWSIGTGLNASPEIALDVISFIRKTIEKMYGKDVSEAVHILYGGSVKPNNIHSYLANEEIDGALVGGASLEVESFRALLTAII